MIRTFVGATLAGALAALAAHAAVSAYDFTGQWDGSAETPGKPAAMVSSTLATTVAPEFAGTLTVVTTEETFQCTVSGRQRRRVTLHADCDNGGRLRLKGVLDATSGTLSGKMVWVPPPSQHKPPKHGEFTLTKQS
jgi:hypothetical protein